MEILTRPPRTGSTRPRHPLIFVPTTALSMAAVITLAGCGASDPYDVPETLVPLSGTVILDGAPAEGVAVHFIPDGKTSGMGGWAVTDPTGSFSAKHYSNADGVPPGTYRVTFSRVRMPTGQPIPEGLDAADVGAVETLPPHLTGAAQTNSPQMVTVTGPNQNVTLEISTGSRRRS